MAVRTLRLLVLIAPLAACQSFSDVCRDAAGGPGWSTVQAPDWSAPKVEELDWGRGGKVHWFFHSSGSYRACRYRSARGIARCGGPDVAEYTLKDGEWSGSLESIHVCH
jgi:hypothetical protein